MPASGDKITLEADAAYGFRPGNHDVTIEAELIRSHFSRSRSDVYGGYVLTQLSLFDTSDAGDLDVFLRYDLVSLGHDAIAQRARQQALRAGFNYNLPRTGKLASLHLEYARNSVQGPTAIVTQARTSNEFRIGLRVSLQRYARH